jgi:thiosulfate reductase/polysulfide reductase chain A
MSNDTKLINRRFSRRTFLKATGALGAAAALTGAKASLLSKQAGALAQDGDVKVIPSWCHGCGPAKVNCAVLCTVKDGKFVGIEGNPDAGNNWGRGSTSICVKAHSAMQYVYSSNRLTYPMKRVGERGEGKFQRITWDEALTTIASKIMDAKAKYGAESYAALSPEAWAVIQTVGRRFLHVHGSPNYLHSGICANQRSNTHKCVLGSASATPSQLDKTALLVNWGANVENTAVNQGELYNRLDQVARGMKLIDIRPMLDPMATKADIWLPVRPGTDCALALAFLNVIINEKLYDPQFVADWCYGFDKLVEHVQPFTPEWASPITGIPVEKIVEVARMLGTIKPMGMVIGNGVGDQQNDGNHEVMAMDIICAITGNLDIPGGGGAAWSVGPSLIPTKSINTLADRAPKDRVEKLVAPEFPRWYQKDQMMSGTQSAYFKALMSIVSEKPYPIRVLNAQQSNPLSATRNPAKIAEALKKIDFVWVTDLWWAPHVDYADIVLPACASYEHSHQLGTKNYAEGSWIGIRNVVVEPLGESRSDWQIYLDIAVKCGYGADFWNGDMDACLREQLDGSGVTLEDLRAAPTGIFVARTKPRPAEPQYKRYAELFKALPYGKFPCYNEYQGGKPDNYETGKLPYLPEYVGPPESITNTPDLVKEYPLVISDVHGYRLCGHSHLVNVAYLRELQPYPWVKINPATAKKYGIKDGGWMKVESKYGWIKMVAEYFEGIAPDVLMTRRGWWQPCEELGLPGYSPFNGGSEVNMLYNSDLANFDKFHSAMAKQTLVKISKA